MMTAYELPVESLPDLADEELVSRAQAGDLRARHALIERHRSHAEALVVSRVKQLGLRGEDLRGARQYATLVLLEAIAGYDLAETQHADGCHFPSFLNGLLRHRSSDYARGVFRYERRLDRSKPLDAGGAAEAIPARRFGDPARQAERAEVLARLRQELNHLSDTDRLLVEALEAGLDDQRVAVQLGVCPKTIQRWRKALLSRLRAILA